MYDSLAHQYGQRNKLCQAALNSLIQKSHSLVNKALYSHKQHRFHTHTEDSAQH